ncbi:hypothetical protein C8R47DRAFT_932322, partial [Mycena vitilis]
PKWAADAHATLLSGGGGEKWARVVEMWWRHEGAVKFEGPGKGQQAKLRPASVAGWVARARTGGPNPPLSDVYAFAAQWWKWWDALNPGWRRKGLQAGQRMKKGEGEWGSTVQTGPNGMLNVLICLRWWRDKVDDSELPKWEEALEDVEWVLER